MKNGMHCESDKLDELTMGRIALKLLIRGMVKNKEILGLDHRQRECPNIAKEIGEKTEEVQEFIRCITPSIIGRIIGSEHVLIDEWVDTKIKWVDKS